MISTVIPDLAAYKSVLVIKDIMEEKAAEKKKELEKAEREGRKVTFADGEGEDDKKDQITEEQIYWKRIEQRDTHASQFSSDA